MESESDFVGKEPCPSCGSRDNLARYSDGHAYCFGCEYFEPGEGGGENPHQTRGKVADGLIRGGEIRALIKRGITEETCQKFGYTVADFKDQKVQVAPYRDAEGMVCAQKIRFANKDFKFLGDAKAALLFGQHLWSPSGKAGAKKLVITEGEIDAMSVSQLQGNKWPVVSVPNGAQGAAKSLKRHLDWLQGFDEVILMFDMDEPGRRAVSDCVEIFPPGKCRIAELPLKDANEMLVAGRGAEVITAIWQARVYRPDGILDAAELWDQLQHMDDTASLPYPWPELNIKTRGQRRGELVTWTAGSGMGKSAIVREIAFDLLKRGETVGMLMLEENVKRTALGMLGLELNRPLHIDREGVSEEEIKTAFDATLGTGRLFLYDHFGSTDIDNLLNRVRYMAKSLGCGWIILDHLSIVVSGIEGNDERKLIDLAMTKLRTLVEETGIGLHLVSHLRRPEGAGHEEGARTSLSQLRGSHSIAQLSDLVIGAERDQQGDDPNLTTLRILKNRFTGETGEACQLTYDPQSGRLSSSEGSAGDGPPWDVDEKEDRDF